jgi:hypothetical protein
MNRCLRGIGSEVIGKLLSPGLLIASILGGGRDDPGTLVILFLVDCVVCGVTAYAAYLLEM